MFEFLSLEILMWIIIALLAAINVELWARPKNKSE